MDARKGLSVVTRKLLATPEGQYHDFKATIDALKVDDMVAFANSDGGSILLGVSAPPSGAPKITGCAWDDKAELSVRQRAAEADPPLGITLRAENTGKRSVLVVHIPRSPHRPHCTQSGRYLVRDGNKNRALKPTEMLRMFLETQSGEFIARFQSATRELSDELRHVKEVVHGMDKDVTLQLEETHFEANNAHALADQAVSLSGEANAGVNHLQREVDGITDSVGDLGLMLRQVVDHLGLDRPEVSKMKNAVHNVAAMYVHLMKERADGDSSDVQLLAEFLSESRFIDMDHARKVLGDERLRATAVEGFAFGRSLRLLQNSDAAEVVSSHSKQS
jgi:hypothetical protein